VNGLCSTRGQCPASPPANTLDSQDGGSLNDHHGVFACGDETGSPGNMKTDLRYPVRYDRPKGICSKTINAANDNSIETIALAA